jgi:hypothetical protein
VLNDAIDAESPGCSAAVGGKGKVVWAGVRGLADQSTGSVIATDTVFDIASVSKQFTATALLLLVDAGKLTLNDPLAQRLPELPPWAGTVNVGQLMHQTSGIPDYVGLLEAQGFQFGDRTTEDQALRAVAAMPKPKFAPGSQFEYSNSNYLLLGEIVHRVSSIRSAWTWPWIQPDTFRARPPRMNPTATITTPRHPAGNRSVTAASRPRPPNWSIGPTITEPAGWAARHCSTTN